MGSEGLSQVRKGSKLRRVVFAAGQCEQADLGTKERRECWSVVSRSELSGAARVLGSPDRGSTGVSWSGGLGECGSWSAEGQLLRNAGGARNYWVEGELAL